MKIQLQIALLFTGICLSVIIALSVIVYYFANAKAFQDFYTRLELRAVVSSKVNFEPEGVSQETYEQLRSQHLQRLPGEEEYIIRVDTLDRIRHTPLYKAAGEAFFKKVQKEGKASIRRRFQFFDGIMHKTDHGDYLIIVSAVHTFAQNFLVNLRNILIVVCIGAAIVVFSIGLIFSRQVLAPIRSIAKRVNNISVTSLHERLEVREGKDEIAVLASTFNDMLSRLEAAFETQNNFVSNASHELNTPLTAIIGEADYALTKPRDTESYNRSLTVIMMEAEKLQAITRGLLELAQSSFSGNLVYEAVQVDELLHNSLGVARSVYPKCSITLDQSLFPHDIHSLVIRGNAQLFELAISNVLLNACKYSGEKPVTLALAASNSHIIFIISDQGIGIPEGEIQHIYDPFFRASNVRGTRGYGIGLPLARNIIRLYRGGIDIHSRVNVGTEVVIKLPL